MRIGAHVSTEGGLPTAYDRAEAAGCLCMQIFTKNKGAWAAARLSEDGVRAFRDRGRGSAVAPVVAHAAYLLNIASPSREIRERSVDALRVEIERCEALGIPLLVLHPGAHMGAGEAAGLRRVVGALDRVHAETRGFAARVLLETSSGQGTSVCTRFESLGRVLASVREPERLGVCVDTCHVFAAGYDIRSEEGYSATLEELDREVGLGKVLCVHGNDSKRELGSRVDRHEHIGRGHLGRGAFRRILADPRLAEVPLIIELPPEDGMLERNLGVLKSLAPKGRGSCPASRRKRARCDAPRASVKASPVSAPPASAPR